VYFIVGEVALRVSGDVRRLHLIGRRRTAGHLPPLRAALFGQGLRGDLLQPHQFGLDRRCRFGRALLCLRRAGRPIRGRRVGLQPVAILPDAAIRRLVDAAEGLRHLGRRELTHGGERGLRLLSGHIRRFRLGLLLPGRGYRTTAAAAPTALGGLSGRFRTAGARATTGLQRGILRQGLRASAARRSVGESLRSGRDASARPDLRTTDIWYGVRSAASTTGTGKAARTWSSGWLVCWYPGILAGQGLDAGRLSLGRLGLYRSGFYWFAFGGGLRGTTDSRACAGRRASHTHRRRAGRHFGLDGDTLWRPTRLGFSRVRADLSGRQCDRTALAPVLLLLAALLIGG
jgi:hypothetical protein